MFYSRDGRVGHFWSHPDRFAYMDWWSLGLFGGLFLEYNLLVHCSGNINRCQRCQNGADTWSLFRTILRLALLLDVIPGFRLRSLLVNERVPAERLQAMFIRGAQLLSLMLLWPICLTAAVFPVLDFRSLGEAGKQTHHWGKWFFISGWKDAVCCPQGLISPLLYPTWSKGGSSYPSPSDPWVITSPESLLVCVQRISKLWLRKLPVLQSLQ